MSDVLRGAELDDLRAFEAVARLGTVGAAAKELSRTQPSISARLAGLESAWGTRLFFRRARGMEPTPEGKRLLPAARSVLEAAAALDREAGVPLADDHAVRLGSGDALGRSLVPRALRRLLAERPGTKVRMLEGSGERLVRELREGTVDVALLPAVHGVDAGPGVVRQALIESPVEVLLPPGRRPRRGPVQLAGLAGEPLVLLWPGSSFRQAVETAWRAAGLTPRVAVEVGSYSLVRRFVAAGLGAAPVPAVAFAEDSEPAGDLVRRPLAGIAPLRWDVATREAAPLPVATSRLVELLQEEAARCR